jgi:uncharacterized membrane protein YfcA
MPIYLLTQFAAIFEAWPYVAVATVGTLIGTMTGARVLSRIPEHAFRKTVSIIILILGVTLLVAAARALVA